MPTPTDRSPERVAAHPAADRRPTKATVHSERRGSCADVRHLVVRVELSDGGAWWVDARALGVLLAEASCRTGEPLDGPTWALVAQTVGTYVRGRHGTGRRPALPLTYGVLSAEERGS